ncbi:MAG: DUF2231 domain-containing protein [bacterium]|nr:DUF2231 domain-containing protein [bacterium]
MESRTKVVGHPLHPILIVFPLGLFGTAVLFDVLQWVDQDGEWSFVGHYMIGGGIVFGAAAAAAGLRDWTAIPANTRAKRVGAVHGALNVIVMAAFIVSWLLRRENPARPDTLALVFSFGGGLLSVISGWLGGELVYRLRVGVDENAHLNAPNSLTTDGQMYTAPPQTHEHEHG